MDAPTVCASTTIIGAPETKLGALAATFGRIGHSPADALRLASAALAPAPDVADDSFVDLDAKPVSLDGATEELAEWGSSSDWTTIHDMRRAHRSALRARSHRWS